MSEADAFQAEMLNIYLYGRIDQGTGCLRNRTDGGEGITYWTGKNLYKETKAKISLANKGKHNSPKTEFQTGATSWNKGSTGIMIAWNKGKKTGQVPWNKGLTGVTNLKVKCPHCEKIGVQSVMHRWHFSNCKQNN